MIRNLLPSRRALRVLVAPLALVALALGAPAASATNSLFTAWKTAYPNSLSDNNVVSGTGAGCQLCHVSSGGGNNFNAYGFKIREFKQAGQSNANAIAMAATFNSDNDPKGLSNLTEINANAQPGWTPGPHNTTYNGTTPSNNQNPAAGILGDYDGVWLDLGFALAGTGGSPALAGTGTLQPNTAVTFALSNALPNAPAYIIVGFSQLGAPFKGGTLVPAVNFYLSFPVGATGSLTLPALWPAGVPVGFPLFFQFWIKDAGGPSGFSASNALEGFAG